MTKTGEKIAAAREAKGLSPYEVSQRTGLTAEAIRRLERGETAPTWKTVQKIARVLGVSLDSLRDDVLEMPEAKARRGRGRPRKPA